MQKLTKLENGVTVITKNIKNNKTCYAKLVINNAGMYNEPDHVHGISHFLEHLAFTGTKTRSEHDISNLIEYAGGYINAHTSSTETVFHIDCLPEYIELGVDILSDIAQNSIFPEDIIERERNIVLQEFYQRGDNPINVLYEKLFAVAYPNHPAGRTVIGIEQTIKSITRDDILAWYKKHYITSNMIFTCTGDVHHDTFVDYVKKYITIPPETRSYSYPTPMFNNNAIGIIQKDYDQSLIALIWPAFPRDKTNKNRVVDVVSDILGRGFNSKLFTIMRTKYGLTYSVGSYSESSLYNGYFVITTSLTNNNIEKFFTELGGVLRSFKDSITEDDIQRTKNYIKFIHNQHCNNNKVQANVILTSYHKFGKLKNPKEKLDYFEKLTKDDLVKCIDEIFSVDPSIVIVGNNVHYDNEKIRTLLGKITLDTTRYHI